MLDPIRLFALDERPEHRVLVLQGSRDKLDRVLRKIAEAGRLPDGANLASG